ncbi:hypothetical protein GCM10023226_16380 [Nocardioides nanhaiensis]|uniref:Uncharacterized protein n=1 Tax=Nocardioides nanhaiensis TaxID=1476871 RepID=A0ABP8W401_9ACTN
MSRLTSAALAVLAATTVAVLAGAVLAAPASADVPEGWPEAPGVDILTMLGLFVGLPVLMAVVIVAFMYVPPVVRGESIKPGSGPVTDQWLGGPRRSAGELAAPDGAQSRAGGASGRW